MRETEGEHKELVKNFLLMPRILPRMRFINVKRYRDITLSIYVRLAHYTARYVCWCVLRHESKIITA